MNRDSAMWRGYIPAITTPFYAQDELDVAAPRTPLEWLAEQGMHGLIVAGKTGKWFSMNREERSQLFSTAGDVLKGVMPLIAGCNAFTALNLQGLPGGLPRRPILPISDADTAVVRNMLEEPGRI